MAEHVRESTVDKKEVEGVVGRGIGSVKLVAVASDIGGDVVVVLTLEKRRLQER
jgi:hypothetical protein